MSYTKKQWILIVNTSWGEKVKEIFPDAKGWLICVGSKLIAIGSFHNSIGMNSKEAEANAKLAVCAPELLEALQAANDMLLTSYPEYQYSETAVKIEEIIKKATT